MDLKNDVVLEFRGSGRIPPLMASPDGPVPTAEKSLRTLEIRNRSEVALVSKCLLFFVFLVADNR